MDFYKIGTFFVALLIAGTTAVSAQDLIARQAPVDRKLKSIDSLALKRQITKEVATYSASNLYPSWDNDHVHVYGKSELPEAFRIDLRNFTMPTPSRKITSRFAFRWGRRHNGLDVKVNVGDTIYAAFDGKVRVVKYERGGYGKYIVVRHLNGLETIYGHLSAWLVDPNEDVRSGQPIGLGGNTGRSTGSHLHFETRFLGVALNPELLFDFANQDVTGDFYAFNSAPETSSSNERLASSTETSGSPSSSTAVTPYHKVRKGDTLYKIANQRGISLDKLCKLNGLTKSTKLRLGQVLRCS